MMNSVKIFLSVAIVVVLGFFVLDLSKTNDIGKKDYHSITLAAERLNELVHISRVNTLKKARYLERQVKLCEGHLAQDFYKRAKAVRIISSEMLAHQRAFFEPIREKPALAAIPLNEDTLATFASRNETFTQQINKLNLINSFISPIPIVIRSASSYYQLYELDGKPKAIWDIFSALLNVTYFEMEDLPITAALDNSFCTHLPDDINVVVVPKSEQIMADEPFIAEVFLSGANYFVGKVLVTTSVGTVTTDEYNQTRIKIPGQEVKTGEMTINITAEVTDMIGIKTFDLAQKIIVH